ncbi:MAG: NUDIX domain-containing protein, partial [Calditerricola sp.]|nr:NUDIX domain-containing protein [Calditerricola sp.]
MQRVTNCVLRDGDRVLLLRKPRRGWWVAPGGKMEPTESVTEAVIREYREETGLTLVDPALRGVFTVLIEDGGRVVDEWMLFTFYAERYEGKPVMESPEG